MNWLRTYAKTHLFYIILIVGGVVSFRVWLQEHDARVAADAAVKQLQTQVVTVQAQAAQKVEVVKQVVTKATTPTAVAAVLPSLTNLPLAPEPVLGDPTALQVEAVPLVQLAGDDKETHIQLEACQQVNDLKDKQIGELKKKPKFLSRVKHVAEAVGVGIAVGFILAK